MRKIILTLVITLSIILSLSCNSKENESLYKELIEHQTSELIEEKTESTDDITVVDIVSSNSSVYALYRNNKVDNDYGYEYSLWRLSPNETSEMIYEGFGYSYDFIINNYNSIIALKNSKTLMFYSKSGEIIREFSYEDLGYDNSYSIAIEKWNESGNQLWIKLDNTEEKSIFMTIDMNSWEVESFELDFVEAIDYDLNPNTGWIVVSDFPFMLEVYHRREYEDNEILTNLYLYNLKSEEKIFIDSYKSNEFKPSWGDDDYFYYQKGLKIEHYSFQN